MLGAGPEGDSVNGLIYESLAFLPAFCGRCLPLVQGRPCSALGKPLFPPGRCRFGESKYFVRSFPLASA